MSVAWHRPLDVVDALRHMEHGGTALAGGAALLSPALAPSLTGHAVDVLALLDDAVRADSIGAGTTLAALATDPVALERWPAIAAAAASTATPQVRAVATVGGGLAARLPTADLPAALAAHAAVVSVVTRGVHAEPEHVEIAVVDYLAEPPPTSHLVLAVRLTRSGRSAYRRLASGPGPAPALATVAGLLGPDGHLELWAGAVGPTPAPIRLAGDPDPDRMRDDDRASAAYRARLVVALAAEVRAELIR